MTFIDDDFLGLPLPLTGRTRLFAIIGDPIAQAGSPGLFNRELRRRNSPGALVPIQVSREDLVETFSGLWKIKNLDGLVITVPHKIACHDLINSLGPIAQQTGAVNAIRRRGDQLEGENFDGLGFIGGLKGAGHELVNKRVLVIGCGGAGAAVAFAIAKESVSALYLYDIDTNKCLTLANKISKVYPHILVSTTYPDLSTIDAVVNCTSLGMKHDDPLPVAIHELNNNALAIDIVLEPEMTPFLTMALQRGMKVHTGPKMLKAQVSAICDFFGV